MKSGQRAIVSAVARWLLPRLALRAFLLIAILGTVFAAIDFLPGNAASTILGSNRTPEQMAALEYSLGLNEHWTVRYLHWLERAAGGDFGTSVYGRQISELLAAAFPVTLATTGLALLVTLLLSGIVSMWWANKSDRALSARMLDWFSVSLIALPEFVFGVFLVWVFALWLKILPAVTISVGGLPAETGMYVLPVLTLVIPQVAWNSRILRSALVDVLSSPAVENARLNGIEGARLFRNHVFPRAIPTFATSIATSTGVLVAGTITVEALFNHPGVGLLISNAVGQRDVSVLVAAILVVGVVILTLMTLADAIKAMCTPRMSG